MCLTAVLDVGPFAKCNEQVFVGQAFASRSQFSLVHLGGLDQEVQGLASGLAPPTVPRKEVVPELLKVLSPFYDPKGALLRS